MKLFICLFSSFLSFSVYGQDLRDFQDKLLELSPQALNLYDDTLVVQGDGATLQKDYSWPQGTIDLKQGAFFYASVFNQKAFKTPQQGLLTLEYLQGVTLQSFGLLKSKPRATPWAENCVHHEIQGNSVKLVGYSLICFDDKQAWFVFSSYPMSPTFIQSLFRGK